MKLMLAAMNVAHEERLYTCRKINGYVVPPPKLLFADLLLPFSRRLFHAYSLCTYPLSTICTTYISMYVASRGHRGRMLNIIWMYMPVCEILGSPWLND